MATAEGTTTAALREGAHGRPVVRVQLALVHEGYGAWLGPAGADGEFGPRTAWAVRAFQRDRGTAVDGLVGPVTLARLGLGLDLDR
ncbi:peptidoglycan-binding domain-containing protein [Kitasatospora viridis]|uniref:Putative peptidoglycan binding protein n=1 Tax=Kitasatospora viridis TaxID=281105 RepID=A0A561SE46_9ACTN|nr:peptidoglycan-binding domain-containing protein [Kitasatospora viridis]TWF73120.1 putative peptidoglycan binding protein [Kitasatospora viridis]